MRRPAARATAVVALALAAGCGQQADDDAAVAWDGKPVVAPHPELPGDRIATGKLRNDSSDDLKLSIRDAKVVDANGRPLRATVSFAAGATHALYPPREPPREDPVAQQERLGYAATIEPGESVPLTVAWHASDGPATRVDLGAASIDLPRER